MIDCRGRPFTPPGDPAVRNAKLFEWFQALNMYPEGAVEKIVKV